MRRFESILNGSTRSFASMMMRGVLWVASQPYGVVVQFRNWMYDRGWYASRQASLPVISIGNLTAGGTGKTPACVMFARWFRNHGVRVAILSRGYRVLEDGTNDEARELELLLPDVPHLQSPDRCAMAELADQELGMQLLLLDDGFQHRKIRRDLDVILIDATEPFGYGYLLPRGLLREPIRSLRRADMVIATRSDQVDRQRLSDLRNRVQRYNPKAAWLEAEHEAIDLVNCSDHRLSLDALSDRRVFLLSAIGNPGTFEVAVKRLGAQVVEHAVFADHHPYSRSDMERLESRISAIAPRPEMVICTGKDLAKVQVPTLAGIPLFSLRIAMKIASGEVIFQEHMERILGRIQSS